MIRLRDDGKSSMFYWWDKVKDLGIPVPRTVMIRWDGKYDDLVDLIDGKPSVAADRFVGKVVEAVEENGYPTFLRSDGAANKHDWARSCYVDGKDKVRANIANLVEFSLMVDIGFDGVAVREFLDLDWTFKSHNGMPVAAERRYFVNEGKVECWHPYWAPSAIRRPTEENWVELLKDLQAPRDGEVETLTSHAEKVGKSIGGRWSVDFCRHRNGTWYLTDMAVGEVSYHWGTCPNAEPENFKRYGDPEKLPEREEGLSDLLKELVEK